MKFGINSMYTKTVTRSTLLVSSQQQHEYERLRRSRCIDIINATIPDIKKKQERNFLGRCQKITLK